MKKVLCLLVVLTMVVGCISISASAAEYGTVLNNNVALMVGSTNAIAMNSLQKVPVAPVIMEGEVLIPLRAVSEIFNGVVNYDAATGIIDIQFGPTKTVVLREGSKQYTINGRVYNFEVAPQVIDGTTMVPLMALARDIIGKSVFYDSSTGLIVISNRKVIKDAVTDAAVISVIASAISCGNVPESTVPKSYQLDWGFADGTGGVAGGNYDVGQLKFVSVNASAEPEANNPASNVNDGSIGSFWAVGDVGADIICDLGKVNAITEIKVGFAKSGERAANYELWVSADNSNYQQVFAGASTQGQPWATHTVSGAYRYVKLVSNGNSTGSTWNSIAEIQAYNNAGGDTSSTVTTYETIKPSTIVASSEPEPENNAAKVNDEDPGSYWAVSGPADITLDLGSAKTVSSVVVQMRAYDDGRSINYGVSYSADGTNYTSVFDGTSEPGGAVQETHNVGASARYIKVNVNGSTTGDWASVAEVVVNGAATTTTTTTTASTGSGSLIKPSSIVASSEPEPENNAAKVNDEDPGSYWAVNGAADITLDLGSAQTVNSVMVQMRAYDDGRSINYGVSYSADGTNYTSVFDGTSEPGGSAREDHNVGASARYIRISVNGSTTGDWASVSEIEVYGAGTTTTTTTTTVDTQSTGALQNMSNVSGTFVLAVQGTNNVLTVDSDNSTLKLAANSGDSKQKWTKDGDGVKNNGVGYYLDVFNQSYDEGGQVGVWESNGGDNQKWTFENKGDYYLIKSNMSGLYLSAVGNSIQQRIEVDATKWVVSDGTTASAGSVSLAGAADFKNMSSVKGNFVIALQGTSNVLTVGSDNFTLNVSAYTQSGSQQWSMDGESVKNNGTGIYMDVSGQSYDAGAQICVWEGNGGDNQKWTFENKGDYYLIKSNMSGLYLSMDGSNVVQKLQNGASKWVIADAGTTAATTTAASGSFTNMASVNGDFVMAVQGTSNVLTVGSDNFTLSVSAYTKDAKQQWSKDGDAVKNNGAGIYMDVSGQSYDAGAQICVWEGNGGDNQKWTFENQGDYYLIKSNMSGLYLSVVGSDVQQQAKANATKWVVAAK